MYMYYSTVLYSSYSTCTCITVQYYTLLIVHGYMYNVHVVQYSLLIVHVHVHTVHVVQYSTILFS